MPISFALTSIIFPNKIFLDEKLFLKFLVFKIYKFLPTLLRLEQWQERLAGTWQTDDRNLVWFGKIERKYPNF
jgi:hypothetical protein